MSGNAPTGGPIPPRLPGGERRCHRPRPSPIRDCALPSSAASPSAATPSIPAPTPTASPVPDNRPRRLSNTADPAHLRRRAHWSNQGRWGTWVRSRSGRLSCGAGPRRCSRPPGIRHPGFGHERRCGSPPPGSAAHEHPTTSACSRLPEPACGGSTTLLPEEAGSGCGAAAPGSHRRYAPSGPPTVCRG